MPIEPRPEPRPVAALQRTFDSLSESAALTQQPALSNLASSLVANGAHQPKTVPPPALESGERYFQAAARAVEEGDDGAAEAALRKALYLDQELALAHLLGAWLCKRRGDVRGLQHAFQRVLDCLEGHPPHDEVPLGEGLTWGELERIARAELGPRTFREATR